MFLSIIIIEENLNFEKENLKLHTRKNSYPQNAKYYTKTKFITKK
jgi:hypothetical protein